VTERMERDCPSH